MMVNILLVSMVAGTCSAQFFMPGYLNETKDLMDLDVAIVRGMNKPYAKSQIAQVIHDTYEFYSKLEDVCEMVESHDATGFRIYDEFMHKDQVGVLKMGPHCTAVEYNETKLVMKYNWTEENATELMMNVRGILYSWNKLDQLRKTFVITTTTTTKTTTTTTTTTIEPPKNQTIVKSKRRSKGITRSPRPTGKTRGTYKKRTTNSTSAKNSKHIRKKSVTNIDQNKT
uniref:Uncharacterized protein n=1 Tax=Homalodisca liturata TaxID=320908 RepID=A0A1B6ICD6_9HEMI